ncbi:selenocysteine insertion sequence-binding protein 2 isoform X2 [Antennarius striatus]|uniref:selenocysteine insertion sequence-binding protein 2 isoform X2 n=1 Tax=Antennarius striatus TaxID=241820 RepID=UPI0035AEC1FD
MDKEKNSSSRQGRQKKDPAELQSCSLPLTSPDGNGSKQSSRGNQSSVRPKQIATSPFGGMSKSHGYSSSRPIRTISKNNDTLPQGKVMVNNSKDTYKKGFRGTRSTPNSAQKSKSPQANFIPFDANLTDFPELGVHTSVQRTCWDPAPQSTSIMETSLSWKSDRRESPELSDSQQIATNGKEDSPMLFLVQPVQTSWANIASQPPKKLAPKEQMAHDSSMQMEEIAAQQEDGTQGKKKRKRKKKRAKGTGEEADAESEGPAMFQEPPKFEDEEEFPGLTLTLTRNERYLTGRNDSKLCSEENQRRIQSRYAEETQEISPAPKSQPPETAKKGQKTEKVSGKKSKAPVQLDIGNMLATLEKKQQSQKTKQDAKPIILSVSGPVVQKQQLVQKKPAWQQDKIAHNPLDSTSPLVKKGKQREVPKPKKPTPLKKVILKEREERKQRRLLEERGLLPEIEVQPEDHAAEEEQSETDITGKVVGSPVEEMNDESELDATNQRDSEEETNEDKITQQQTVTSEPCPANRLKIHSRKFRDYCSQMLSKDVDECVTALLKELVRFQDRLYQKDPMKARMKRRIVMGLREVLKHLKLRKVKCVVISPNCERIQSKGGLDEALYTIIDTCREQGVPFVFALSRRALGRCVNKAVPVSLVGIFNYDGAQDFYHKMIELSSEARSAYEVMVSSQEWMSQVEGKQEADTEEGLQISSLAQKAEISAVSTELEEPEYIKVWKKLLAKDCNHKFLNFEEQLSSMCLEEECTENTEEDRS